MNRISTVVANHIKYVTEHVNDLVVGDKVLQMETKEVFIIAKVIERNHLYEDTEGKHHYDNFDPWYCRKIITTSDETLDEAIEALTARLMGFVNTEKVRIRIPNTTPDDITVGSKFWYWSPETTSLHQLVVTYVRSGVFFFNSDEFPDEQFAPVKCMFATKLEPAEYIAHNLNPEKYEIVTKLDQTQIIYEYGTN